MKFIPHKYQENAIGFMLGRAGAGLFLSPGLGKTSISLMVFNILKQKKLSRKVLVLAPLRVVYSVWAQEVSKWDELQHLSVGILHGKDKDKVLSAEHDVYVMNYEGLQWLEAATRRDFPFDMLVIDESSKMKHTSTRRFKTIKKILGKFSRKYILTGSPAANGLLDLFGQMYCMDQGATFGAYVTQYKNEFFYQAGFGGYEWKLKPLADQLIYKKLEGKVMRLKAEDYLDMPELIKTDIVVELEPAAQLQYMTMEKRLQADFEEGKITASNSGVAAMKCRQIASGSVYGEDGTVHHVHSAKIEALEDLIEELEGEPLLVGYEFKHEAEAIQKALGKHIPIIGGGISANAAAVIIEAWNRGEVPVLLAQSASLAHGVNLQAGGRHMCWYTLTYNLEVYEQFIARLYRQGQEDRVFVYHLMAKNTIDYVVKAVVATKDKNQQTLLQALGNYWNKKSVQ